MIKNGISQTRMAMNGVLSVLLLGTATTSMAQAVPPDFIAASDVYKVVAENDQYRLVEATWKPGQRDAFHSHPAMLYYWVTACSVRFYMPDGKQRDATITPGQSGAQVPVASHSVENVSQSECKIVMLESK
jgi:quercetin dioxygenase-like cupin family protein